MIYDMSIVPWSPDYVLTIMVEIRDRAAEALQAAEDE
jgi:hypothetical protein